MPLWLVKATWIEDDADMTEQWAVNAETIDAAVRAVTARLPFSPHHVEARRSPDAESDAGRVLPAEPQQVQSE